MGRRVFVGDLQGCHAELVALLDEVEFEPGVDRLYSVGDAVNRGPDSAACVRLLRQLDAVMVLGNHELHLFDVLAGRREIKGRDTMHDILAAPDRDQLIDWLRQRPLLHVEDDVVMVHAALSPAWDPRELDVVAARLRAAFEQRLLQGAAPEDPELSFAVSTRYCDAEGNAAPQWRPPPGPPYQPWDFFWTGEQTVVFGHWAQRGLVARDRVKGLDTGCVYGRVLSAWIAEEDRFVQVPAAKAYCAKTEKSARKPLPMGPSPDGSRRLCVFCGSSPGDSPRFVRRARQLGRSLAERGWGLVYGAGNIGLMGELANAALEAGAEVQGVIPRRLVDMEVCHLGLTDLHVVEDMHARKWKMYELADAYLALPGGLGTFEELLESLTWQQLGYHGKPVALLDVDSYYAPLLEQLARAQRRGFVSAAHLSRLRIGDNVEKLLDRIEKDWGDEGASRGS